VIRKTEAAPTLAPLVAIVTTRSFVANAEYVVPPAKVLKSIVKPAEAVIEMIIVYLVAAVVVRVVEEAMVTLKVAMPRAAKEEKALTQGTEVTVRVVARAVILARIVSIVIVIVVELLQHLQLHHSSFPLILPLQFHRTHQEDQCLQEMNPTTAASRKTVTEVVIEVRVVSVGIVAVIILILKAIDLKAITLIPAKANLLYIGTPSQRKTMTFEYKKAQDQRRIHRANYYLQSCRHRPNLLLLCQLRNQLEATNRCSCQSWNYQELRNSHPFIIQIHIIKVSRLLRL
jgi:hypothetical protein